MLAFLYRSLITGMNEGWVADDPSQHNDESYEALTCVVCRHAHLVNPKTDKVVGEDEHQ